VNGCGQSHRVQNRSYVKGIVHFSFLKKDEIMIMLINTAKKLMEKICIE